MIDFDGNSYSIITIGKQTWMAENLRVTKFKNGDPIPHVSEQTAWKMTFEEERPAWCSMNNQPSLLKKYGVLYNWYAATDSRGIAPEGWRLPTIEDWEELLRFLTKKQDLYEFDTTAAPLLKSKTNWGAPGFENMRGNNGSGFNAYGTGFRLENEFMQEFIATGFWSSSDDPDTDMPFPFLIQVNYATIETYYRKLSGFNIRLIKINPK